VTYLSRDGFFCLQILPKFNFGQGSAQDPAGGAYSAPPGPLAGGEGAGSPLPKNPTPASAFGLVLWPFGCSPCTVRFYVSIRWQSFSNGMLCSCRIYTDKCVAHSLFNSRASCFKHAVYLNCYYVQKLVTVYIYTL